MKLERLPHLKKPWSLLVVSLIAVGVSGCYSRPSPHTLGEFITKKKLEDCLRRSSDVQRNAFHVLREGETLYRLSIAYGVRLEEIYKANGIWDPTNIPVGTRILIPGVVSNRSGFLWPVRGSLSSGFGRRGRGFHYGIDLTAPKGTPIRASADGLVVASRNSLDGYRGYGKIVIVEHAGGIRTLYAHNSKNLVSEGECVRAGQLIGEVGNSGNADGSHLHFEVRSHNTPINPLIYLE
jgi:LysM repeat protein